MLDIRLEKRALEAGLHDLQPEWDALLERSTWPTIYSTFDYVSTACRHFVGDEDVFFLLMRNGGSGELLAIFPLSIWIHDLFGVDLRVVAHATTTSFTDVDKPCPIIDRRHDAACWARFAGYFRKEFTRWDLIDFDSTVSASGFNFDLKKLFPRPVYCPKSIPGPEYPLVRLDGEWERFWNEHKTVRRKTRRIEKEIGERLSYTVTNDPADVQRYLAEYIATEQSGWKAGQGVSQADNRKFYQELLPKLAEKGQVYFGMMCDGETVMSAVIAYVYGERIYFALCTYNPAYAYLSAGGVNWTRMVKYFHGKGLVEADFLSGGAGYIYPLADRIGQTQDIMIHRLGLRNGYVALRHAIWKMSVRSKRRRIGRKRQRAKKRGVAYQAKSWPARHTRNIQVEKIYLSDDLPVLAEEWDRLLERSSRPTIYSSFDYIYTSCKHLKGKETVAFLLFRSMDDGRLLAIFPISIWTDQVYGITVETIEHGITTSFTDVDKPYPIIDRDCEAICWQRFRNYFHKEYRKWDVIIYDEVFPDAYLNRALGKLFRFPRYWTKVKPGPKSPMVRLDGEWDRFWRAHPNLRKKDRRLEARIGDRFAYRVTGDPADVERCLNEYIATEQASWKAGEGVSQSENQRFYHDLLPKLAAKGQLFFGMMYDGDTVISAEISYAFKDRVYFALGTYNSAYKRLSPGSVSTARFIKYFHDKGFVEGDFLAGFAHYINPWASRIQTTGNIVVRRMGWKNWYLAGRHLLKKMKARLKRLLAHETAEEPPAAKA